MKNTTGLLPALISKTCLLVWGCFLFSSCLKNKDSTANGPKANMTVSNYVVNGAPLNILYDGGLLTTAPLAYGKSIDTGYIPVGAGIHSLRLTSGTDVIADNTISVQTGLTYSLFLYDTLKNNKVKSLLVEDNLVVIDTVAKARFLQFIPLPANDSLVLLLRKDTSGYQFIDAFVGNKSDPVSSGNFFPGLPPGNYQVQLLRKNVSAPVLFTLPSFTVERGKIYSFIAKGTLTGTGDYAVGLTIMKNN